MIEVIIVSLYVFCLVCILVYCLAEVNLALNYRKHKKNNQTPLRSLPKDLPNEKYPYVTVQLPIFNELYVVERLVDAITAFDYPKNRLQIQILDDSTDETVEISAAKVAEYQAQGFDISLIHRIDRKGYKAGALQEAMPQVKGEFIAIFDADFIPKTDFLLKTLPYFEEEKMGVVQTRWEHINKNYSLLTQIQAFFIDAHFTVEQTGRNVSGYFMNFNGTAGVWRKATIIDAGGWQADTLTEDLDLSYRSQMKGWQFKYLEDVTSPSELPADMRAFKTQQFRWIKGGAETAVKILPRIMRTDLPKNIKFNAFSHLLSSSIYIVIFLSAILTVPLLLVKNSFIEHDYIKYGSLFFLTNFAVGFVYFTAIRNIEETLGKSLKTFFYILPSFLAITLGLSLHNALAALRGLAGEKTPFVRTPKFNITSAKDIWHNKKYTSRQIEFLTLVEGFFVCYFSAGIFLSFKLQSFELLPFYILATIGFGMTFWYSMKHAKVVK